MSNKPKVEKSQLVYEGYFNLREDILKREGKSSHPYSYIETELDAVVILASTPDNKWIIIEEYRHPMKNYIFSIPGGGMEKDESWQEAAKRELLEESGYTSDELVLMGSMPMIPSFCSQMVHFIRAKNVKPSGNQNLDPYEYIDVQCMESSQIEQKILSSENVDGILCSAYLLNKIK